jgi:aryl-alcohol dehydrogenase-like predicted oxidoreductase
MEYRYLGRSGLKVSTLTMGTMTFGGGGNFAKVGSSDLAEARSLVDQCLDAGVNLLDTANAYSTGVSEEMIGEILGGKRKNGLLISSKVRFRMGAGPNDEGLSRYHILREVEASLRRLRTDWIDLYQLHFPDPSTPIEETLTALDALVTQGKVRYVGCSNFTGWMVADADWIARTKGVERFVSVQNEWSLLSRDVEREVTGACERFGASVLPYFPLASGLLTGKVKRGETPPENSRLSSAYFATSMTEANFDRLERLEQWAAAHDRTLTEVALSWLASQPVVGSVIAGATSPEQVRANAASTKTDLTAAEITEIGELMA